jgi:hypothetical protein
MHHFRPHDIKTYAIESTKCSGSISVDLAEESILAPRIIHAVPERSLCGRGPIVGDKEVVDVFGLDLCGSSKRPLIENVGRAEIATPRGWLSIQDDGMKQQCALLADQRCVVIVDTIIANSNLNVR